ncbi:hypothetical protein QNI16_30015 [Cytophagaceae bacterium YF14B1]|uniref:Lipoprotein n=1 Tax=Xanthocytophaga flava TaxID=3048013 RepID=A0AAE3UCG9_9BACT|nr:hypothetical protein [Xanthocytophaga flavus]MDJ1484774.1 hypothetical protein [Xanthocytophaga flavus]
MKVQVYCSYFLLLCCIGFFSCGTDTQNEQKENVATVDSVSHKDSVKSEPTADPISFDRTDDYTSRIIAGMQDGDTNPYKAVSEYTSWKKFAATMDSSWARVNRQRLGKMRNWSETELENLSATTVFYPFSGPDFIHATTFFPKADKYYLFGLEPIGDLPDLNNKSEKDVSAYCEAMQGALRDIFQRSYFLTKKMSADMPKINGVVPMICTFLVRTNHIVTKIQPLLLMENGQTMNWVGTASDSPKKLPRLVRIDFLDTDMRKPKSVFYYSGDLSDNGVKVKPAIKAFLDALPEGCVGYLKSASYLMHYESFSTIRNAMLGKCKAILQDDTGIAYKYYDSAQWNVQLYGVYTPPIEEFKGRFQKELDHDYKDSSRVKPLPFEIGYHWGTHKDNLQLATKK